MARIARSSWLRAFYLSGLAYVLCAQVRERAARAMGRLGPAVVTSDESGPIVECAGMGRVEFSSHCDHGRLIVSGCQPSAEEHAPRVDVVRDVGFLHVLDGQADPPRDVRDADGTRTSGTVSTTECSSSRRPIRLIDQRRAKLHRKRRRHEADRAKRANVARPAIRRSRLQAAGRRLDSRRAHPVMFGTSETDVSARPARSRRRRRASPARCPRSRPAPTPAQSPARPP